MNKTTNLIRASTGTIFIFVGLGITFLTKEPKFIALAGIGFIFLGTVIISFVKAEKEKNEQHPNF